MVEFRKIQKTGGSTYTVSLPKGWVEKRMKAGDAVSLLEKGDFIIVSSKADRQDMTMSCSVEHTGDLGSLVRRFIANYLNGYNTLRVYTTSKDFADRVEIKKTLCSCLPGIEVVEESQHDLTFQNLLKHSEFPFRSTLRRMHFLTLEMLNSLLGNLNRLDGKVIDGIKGMEKDIDRFFILGKRQLTDSSLDPMRMEALGLEAEKQCIEYMLAINILEKVADHVEMLADIMMRDKPSDSIMNNIAYIGKECLSIYSMAMDALFRGDIELAEKTIGRVKKLTGSPQKIPRQHDFLLYNFLRIAENAADISELVIDMNVKTTGRQINIQS